uniref:Dehydrogenase/reductase SDR family member 7B n=1 Tax=Esox lucius TaxID=8010 RepID=A0AAY5L6V8_ESOLU
MDACLHKINGISHTFHDIFDFDIAITVLSQYVGHPYWRHSKPVCESMYGCTIREDLDYLCNLNGLQWHHISMERVMGGVVPLVLGGLGLVLLYRLIQRVKQGAVIQDAVVVITGASSGLGRECAQVFHDAGARLVLCGRDEARLQDVVQELKTTTDNSQRQTYTPRTVTFDLSNTSETVAMAAEEILRCYGHVDILINNAGISYRGNILDTHISVQRNVMDTNYFGPIALTQALLPSMVRRHSGHIVVISSVQGKISIPYRSAYAASKHATQAYFDCLRAELEHYNIQVTVVSPGYIKTNLSLNAVTGDGSKYGVEDKTTTAGRDPKDVAQVVLMAVRHRSKDIVLAGLLPTLAVYIRTLWPTLFFKLMATRARKEQKPKDE